MPDILKETSEKLLQLIIDARERFKAISEVEWSRVPAPGKWSKKQILGHLIDSSANNHLRFVRAQLADDVYRGIGYEQDFFVETQKYDDADTQQLIDLWFSYNQHLGYIITGIDTAKLNDACYIGNNEPVPFSFVITDYVDHLQHHLSDIIGTR